MQDLSTTSFILLNKSLLFYKANRFIMQALHPELQVAAMTHISESNVAGANPVMLGCSVLKAKLTLYPYPIQIDRKISPLQNDLENMYEY